MKHKLAYIMIEEEHDHINRYLDIVILKRIY